MSSVALPPLERLSLRESHDPALHVRPPLNTPLSTKVLVEIFSRLEPLELVSPALVCHRWRDAAREAYGINVDLVVRIARYFFGYLRRDHLRPVPILLEEFIEALQVQISRKGGHLLTFHETRDIVERSITALGETISLLQEGELESLERGGKKTFLKTIALTIPVFGRIMEVASLNRQLTFVQTEVDPSAQTDRLPEISQQFAQLGSITKALYVRQKIHMPIERRVTLQKMIDDLGQSGRFGETDLLVEQMVKEGHRYPAELPDYYLSLGNWNKAIKVLIKLYSGTTQETALFDMVRLMIVMGKMKKARSLLTKLPPCYGPSLQSDMHLLRVDQRVLRLAQERLVRLTSHKPDEFDWQTALPQIGAYSMRLLFENKVKEFLSILSRIQDPDLRDTLIIFLSKCLSSRGEFGRVRKLASLASKDVRDDILKTTSSVLFSKGHFTKGFRWLVCISDEDAKAKIGADIVKRLLRSGNGQLAMKLVSQCKEEDVEESLQDESLPLLCCLGYPKEALLKQVPPHAQAILLESLFEDHLQSLNCEQAHLVLKEFARQSDDCASILEGYQRLLELYLQKGKITEAISLTKEYHQVLKKSPFELLKLLLEFHMRNENPEVAVQAFRITSSTFPLALKFKMYDVIFPLAYARPQFLLKKAHEILAFEFHDSQRLSTIDTPKCCFYVLQKLLTCGIFMHPRNLSVLKSDPTSFWNVCHVYHERLLKDYPLFAFPFANLIADPLDRLKAFKAILDKLNTTGFTLTNIASLLSTIDVEATREGEKDILKETLAQTLLETLQNLNLFAENVHISAQKTIESITNPFIRSTLLRKLTQALIQHNQILVAQQVAERIPVEWIRNPLLERLKEHQDEQEGAHR